VQFVAQGADHDRHQTKHGHPRRHAQGDRQRRGGGAETADVLGHDQRSGDPAKQGQRAGPIPAEEERAQSNGQEEQVEDHDLVRLHHEQEAGDRDADENEKDLERPLLSRVTLKH